MVSLLATGTRPWCPETPLPVVWDEYRETPFDGVEVVDLYIVRRPCFAPRVLSLFLMTVFMGFSELYFSGSKS